MRSRVAAVLELGSTVALIVGAAVLHVAAGWLVGGLMGLWYAKRLAGA